MQVAKGGFYSNMSQNPKEALVTQIDWNGNPIREKTWCDTWLKVSPIYSGKAVW